MSHTVADAGIAKAASAAQIVDQHIVEIVSDSGEGAQTCGQMFADLCARNGNGIWTVEIIPAEIEPPSRSRAGASGNRIRLGSKPVTNAGDCADVVVALNEQVLYSRIDAGALRAGTIVFVDKTWAEHDDPDIRSRYAEAIADFHQRSYFVVEAPIEAECRKHTDDPKKGKNMWVLGMLCAIYDLDRSTVAGSIAKRFGKKGEAVIQKNIALFDDGYDWALAHVQQRYHIPANKPTEPMVVMNGNQAIGLGARRS